MSEFTFGQLQRELRPWVEHNFGHRPLAAWRPLMGVCEEAGELLEATDHDSALDAVGDFMVYAADYCNQMEWDLDSLWLSKHPQPMLTPLSPMEEVFRGLSHMQHHHLKGDQGIRTKEDHQEQGKVWLRHALYWLNELRETRIYGSSVETITERVWSRVKERDWTKNMETGDDGA